MVGFVLSAYLGVPVLGIAIIGFAAAFWYFTTEINKADAVTMAAAEHAMRWEMILMSNEMNKEMSQGTDVQTEERYQVTKRDLRKTAARYNFMACNIFNYESQMGPAIAWAMAPVLRKIYKKECLAEEYMKNRGKYNCFDEANNCLFSICLLLFFHTKISSI